MCVKSIMTTPYEITCFKLKPVPNFCVMLNYRYLKSFGSKISPSISSQCKRDSLLNSFNAVRVDNDQSRPLHKSCSLQLCKSDSYVPNRSESTSWRKSKKAVEKKFFQKTINHQNATTLIPNRELSTEEADKLPEQNESIKYKYQDTCKQDKYELEAARPRKIVSHQVFNVFKSVADKEIDLNELLQPSNLKLYGAQDHIYSPILMSNKNSCLVFTNPSYLPPGRQSVTKNNEDEEMDEE